MFSTAPKRDSKPREEYLVKAVLKNFCGHALHLFNNHEIASTYRNPPGSNGGKAEEKLRKKGVEVSGLQTRWCGAVCDH